ncbi:putative secreted protein [Sinobacterium caligoides]|uniref:Putative secreted protein n=1 Tax=Sinobacterium caligoides TaxID=933926 RepID=A0A3N2DYI7_9GAMM|nr:VPLPA-CTERM sorting domain-containing protein [Sinobacterium caligoides]ROS04920.1 putative secreted protein [Sinobacterium caligoides]
MLLRKFTQVAAVLTLSSAAVLAQAATIIVDGVIDSSTGALASLAPSGTDFGGDFDFDAGDVSYGNVILAGFCFNSTASGAPPATPDCPSSKSVVPFLTTGSSAYTGDVAAPDATYQQAGTTFDGVDGALKLLAFSPSFGVNILIDVMLNADGSGSLVADAGFLGTAEGALNWQSDAPEVPVPAAAWLFGSAIAGLAAVRRRQVSR